MTYIFFLFVWGSNGTIASTTAEFNTFEQCQYAVTVANKQLNPRVAAAYCLEKGKAK